MAFVILSSKAALEQDLVYVCLCSDFLCSLFLRIALCAFCVLLVRFLCAFLMFDESCAFLLLISLESGVTRKDALEDAEDALEQSLISEDWELSDLVYLVHSLWLAHHEKKILQGGDMGQCASSLLRQVITFHFRYYALLLRVSAGEESDALWSELVQLQFILDPPTLAIAVGQFLGMDSVRATPAVLDAIEKRAAISSSLQMSLSYDAYQAIRAEAQRSIQDMDTYQVMAEDALEQQPEHLPELILKIPVLPFQATLCLDHVALRLDSDVHVTERVQLVSRYLNLSKSE
jgi:hypothetical protein